MQFASITELVKSRSPHELQGAEQALLAGHAPPFEVAGDSAAEQLTHVLVAQVLLQYMHTHGCGLPAARRAFAQRVRKWVSTP